MKFAVNYSPQAMQLLRTGIIDVDRIKCSSDFPEHIQDAQTIKPVTVHFSLIAGSAESREPDWAMIEDILAHTDTQYVNLHLGATNAEYPNIPADAFLKEDADMLSERMIADVRKVAEHFGTDNVILENWPYHARARSDDDILRICVEPSILNTVIMETGCGLLLDVDHALVASHYLERDVLEYITTLPVDRIRELHMTGTHLHEGWLQSHLPMQKDDWTLLEWVLEKITSQAWSAPDLVAFEYGGTGPQFEWRSDAEVLRTQIPEFQQRIAQAQHRAMNSKDTGGGK